MTDTAAIAVVVLALGGCAERSPEPANAPAAVEPAADSLARTLADGAVWYTLARDARAADGTACVERTLEIRRGSDTVPVPLLYTRDVPDVLDDSTLAARIYRDCVPGDRYRIDLRSGQPTPIR